MTAQAQIDTPAIGAAERFSTRVIFFIAGFALAAWAPLVPYAKARASLDEASLGLLLLCLGAGSIVAMPTSGWLSSRFGCRRLLLVGTLLVALALPLLAFCGSFAGMVGALLLFGAGLGMIDCTMNIQAVLVERASSQPLMSGFHGMFSVGGIAGAAGMSLLLSLGLSPLAGTLVFVAATLALLAWCYPHLLPYGSRERGPLFAVPRGPILLLGVICFILFLTEGAVLDWAAVFLTEDRHMPAHLAGLGYAAFACTMTLGRLTGDKVTAWLGHRRIVFAGALCAALGLTLATAVPSWQAGLLGYALVGLGCSNIVPVMYSLVGQQQTVPESVAVPAISTLGYIGILAGPALIGFLAHLTSLPLAFGAMVAMLLVVAASARTLGRS